MRLVIIASLILFTVAGCTTGNSLVGKDHTKTFAPDFSAGHPTIVYKTRKDYADKVPVLLSEDKSHIISYPDPADVRNSAVAPVVLKNGYLLDQRGIGAQVAFLRLSYKEYAALEKAPSMEELMAMIIDKDPLTELCNCGNRQAFDNLTDQLNELIVSGRLRTECKVIK